jgi:photosystem II stability/assembly factor-like uncharacterized protein
MSVLVATQDAVFALDPARGALVAGSGLEDRHPTSLTTDPSLPGRAWCGTHRSGVFRSDDGGASWHGSGLAEERIMAVTASPAREGLVWAGAEPSRVWRSDDGGAAWARSPGLEALPSSSDWAFPPRPDTHHVRWIACHPHDPDRSWVAIEAGALVSTADGGRTWSDRVPGGPWDTHELAVHPDAPDTLRVSAGDGYFESFDGGATWSSPDDGLEVGYLRSVAVDPGDPAAVVVSAASRPHAAYVAGRSDGRVFRRVGVGPWRRVTEGWPDPPATIAPLLAAGSRPGELWAADERGVHRSDDGGASWRRIAPFPSAPLTLRGLALAT